MGAKVLLNRLLAKAGYMLVKEQTIRELTTAISSGPSLSVASEANGAEAGSVQVTEASAVASPKKTLTLRTAQNTPPQNCAWLAPKFGEGSVGGALAANAVEFQNAGITIVKADPAKALHWRDTENFDLDVGNRHSAWDWAGNSISSYSKNLRAGIPSENLVAALYDLFGSADFDRFFQAVMGCPMRVANCRLVKSLPHQGPAIGPQSWHQDGCPPGVIRGVFYLTDVDEESGPFQYRDAEGGEHTVLGRTGDLLIFDAMRLVHRAMPPKANTRVAIDLIFMPRLPGEAFEVNVAGMNHWPADPFSFKVPDARVSSPDVGA